MVLRGAATCCRPSRSGCGPTWWVRAPAAKGLKGCRLAVSAYARTVDTAGCRAVTGGDGAASRAASVTGCAPPAAAGLLGAAASGAAGAVARSLKGSKMSRLLSALRSCCCAAGGGGRGAAARRSSGGQAGLRTGAAAMGALTARAGASSGEASRPRCAAPPCSRATESAAAAPETPEWTAARLREELRSCERALGVLLWRRSVARCSEALLPLPPRCRRADGRGGAMSVALQAPRASARIAWAGGGGGTGRHSAGQCRRGCARLCWCVHGLCRRGRVVVVGLVDEHAPYPGLRLLCSPACIAPAFAVKARSPTASQ